MFSGKESQPSSKGPHPMLNKRKLSFEEHESVDKESPDYVNEHKI